MKKLDKVKWDDQDEILEIWGTLTQEEIKIAKEKIIKASREIWESMSEREKKDPSTVSSHPHQLDQIFFGSHSVEFMEFEAGLSSLQRFHHHGQGFIQGYFTESQKFCELNESQIREEFKSSDREILYWDRKYFEDYLHGSTLAHLFTLIEKLLSDVANDYMTIENKAVLEEIKKRNRGGNIDHYISFLRRGCGLDVNPRWLWKEIDILRQARNKYIHRLMVDFPARIQDSLLKIFSDVNATGLSKELVDSAFETICDLAMVLQSACYRDSKENFRGDQKNSA